MKKRKSARERLIALTLAMCFGCLATPLRAETLFVTNSDGMLRYSISPNGDLHAIGSAIPASGVIAVVPHNGVFIYAPRSLGNFSYEIDAYCIEPTGAATFIGSIPEFGILVSIAVDPLGRFLYLGLRGNDRIDMYNIGATGALSSAVGDPSFFGRPFILAPEPTGRFLYVANPTNFEDIWAFTVASTGTLTLVQHIAPAGPDVRSLAFDPAGRVAYVTNSGFPGNSPGNITTYAIGSTGVLTQIGLYSTEEGPGGTVPDPKGRFLYQVNSLCRPFPTGIPFPDCVEPPAPNISVHRLAPSGIPNTQGSPVASGSTIAIDPQGRFAFIPSGNDVIEYRVLGSGALMAIGSVPGGNSPRAVFITD